MNHEIKFKKFNMSRTRTAVFKTEEEASEARKLILHHPKVEGYDNPNGLGYNRVVKGSVAVGVCSHVEETPNSVNSTFNQFKTKYN